MTKIATTDLASFVSTFGWDGASAQLAKARSALGLDPKEVDDERLHALLSQQAERLRAAPSAPRTAVSAHARRAFRATGPLATQYGARVGFVPFDPNAQALAAEVSLEPSGEARDYIKTFDVTLRDGTGARLTSASTPTTFTVAWTKDTDTLDLVTYYEKDGELLMGVTEQVRPTKAARPTPESVVHAGLPAGIIRPEEGDVSFDRVAARVLESKVGVAAAGPLETLGASYLPSAGHSPELCFPRAVRVAPPESTDRVRAERGSESHVRIVFETPDQVLAKYFAGVYQDTRLALAAFRLAEAKGRLITLSLNLPDAAPTQQLSSAAQARIVDLERLRALANDTRIEPGRVQSVEVKEAPTPEVPFVRARRYEVQNRDAAGAPVGTAYETVIIERKDRDSVDYGAYFRHDDKLYMVIKRGVRPSIAVREHDSHFFHTQADVIQWEGVAGSLPSAASSASARRDQAVLELREEVALVPAALPVEVALDFPSVGCCNERASRFLGPVAPEPVQTVEQGLDETVDVAYIEINELLRAGREGVVRDPRLLLNAYIIKAALKYEGPSSVDSAT